jgi:hypothetical protein
LALPPEAFEHPQEQVADVVAGAEWWIGDVLAAARPARRSIRGLDH